MSNRRSTIHGLRRSAGLAALLSLKLAAGLAFAQQAPPRDPAEPPPGKPQVKSLPRPASAIRRQSIDEKSMRTLIHSRSSQQQLSDYAAAHGMRSLREDGARWVAQGVTSLEELVRVTGE